jgi:ribosome-binding factor A
MTTVRHRHERVAEEIRHEFEAMLAGELKDPRLSGPLSVTNVTVTPDLKHARVFLAAFGTDDERCGVREGLAAAMVLSEARWRSAWISGACRKSILWWTLPAWKAAGLTNCCTRPRRARTFPEIDATPATASSD